MTSSRIKNSDVEREILRLDYCFDRGVNFADRVIRITGEIEDSCSFGLIDAALSELERVSKKAITLKINSPGGSVYEALAIIGRIRASKCQIITECYGHAMSAASMIFASGDKRKMSKLSWFMDHETFYEVEGKHSTVVEAVKQAEREMQAWSKVMSEFSSESEDFWRAMVHKSEFYLSADECLKLGVADELF